MNDKTPRYRPIQCKPHRTTQLPQRRQRRLGQRGQKYPDSRQRRLGQRRQKYPGSLSLLPRSRKQRHAARTGSIEAGTMLTRGAGRLIIGAGAVTATNDQVQAGEQSEPRPRRSALKLQQSARMKRREFITLLGGTAVAWPLAARAAMPVIGWVSGLVGASATDRVPAFDQGLAETGYVDGRNVAVEYHWAEAQYDRLPALVADLVRRQVTVIVATGGSTALPPPKPRAPERGFF